MSDAGRWMNVSPGQVVIEQGGVGDAFYAVQSGTLDVIEDGEHVRTVAAGEQFGEVALLRDVGRTASVIATTPARVYRLTRAGFDTLVAAEFRRARLLPAAAVARDWDH